MIVEEPPPLVIFNEGEPFELPCVASGVPEPEYYWHANGFLFDPSGTDGRVEMREGEGTLLFKNPFERDEAVYQCFAENEAGTAASVEVRLRMAGEETP